MDGRTRVINAIKRRPLDRIPRYDSFWEDTLAQWRATGLPKDADPDDYFDWDLRMMYLDASLRRQQKMLAADDAFVVYEDRAGYTVRKMVGKSRALEWINHVTKDRDAWDAMKNGFAFDPKAPARIDTQSYFGHMDEYPSWDEAKTHYDRLREKQKYVAFTVYGPWEATWRHRGYTPLLMDLATDPEWVAEMATAQANLVIEVLQHCIDLKMKPDALFLVDDVACTRGLLFSPAIWRTIFKPIYARYGSFLHDHGISFWLHCCGNCSELIMDFIECGLDVLQPLQAQAGMDVRTLKPRYGDALAFWGNIDVSKLAGPADACESEVRDKITAAKINGGYLYHSDHSIPPEISFERYQWIMELVEKYGHY